MDAQVANQIQNISVVGASGNVGSFIISSLLAKKGFRIIAISRAKSQGIFAEGVKVEHVDYDILIQMWLF